MQINPMPRKGELHLTGYGLRYLAPGPVFTMPFRDGRSMRMWRDLDRTCAELARFSPADAEAYRQLLVDWQAMAPIVNEERENPPRPPQEVAARTRAGAMGDRMLAIRQDTALDGITEGFQDERVRA